MHAIIRICHCAVLSRNVASRRPLSSHLHLFIYHKAALLHHHSCVILSLPTMDTSRVTGKEGHAVDHTWYPGRMVDRPAD